MNLHSTGKRYALFSAMTILTAILLFSMLIPIYLTRK